MKIPTEEDAKRITKEALGVELGEIKRFPTGLAHYVYDVVTNDNQKLVVRLAREDLISYFEGAIYWYNLLRPKGIPLPKFIYFELDPAKHGFPVIIMERLPGKDLVDVYVSLSSEQKKVLAQKVVEIQKIANSLPLGKGFSYATSNDSFMDKPLKKSWIEHMEDQLERNRKRIIEAKIFNGEIVEKLKKLLYSHKQYFSSIQPLCFIDDTTTKNVIIDSGKLSGIVDIDSVCFGDQLQVPALTKMSLLSKKYKTDYIDYWLEELNINDSQRIAFNIYTAMYCFNFMSEFGHSFNKEESETISSKQIEFYYNLFNELYANIEN